MANEFIVRKGLVVSGASQQALRTVGNGNILVGSGSTDSGYTFQAVGSVLFVGSGTSSSTSLSVRNIAGDIRLNVQNDGVILVGTGLSSGLGAIIRDSVYNTGLGIHGNDEIRLYSNNAIPFYTKYAGGGTPIKLAPYFNGVVISTDVTNAASIPDPSATFQVTGSRTASSSIARGVFFNNTLTSAANGDTLIGLDVRPTFSVSTYTGYTLLSLRSSGDTLFTTTGGTNTLRTFRTGNILIGSGSTDLGSTLSVIGSSLMSGNTSGSTLLNVVGSQGQLFSVVDTLTGSLMSVNDITGLPILEVFSDDRVVMGEYATNALVVSGRSTGFGVTPSDPNYRIISSGSTLFSGGTMVVKGSGTTSGSTAFAVQNSTGGTLLNLFNNGNLNIDNGALYVNGDNGRVGIGTTSPQYTLDVNGSLRVNNTLFFNTSSPTAYITWNGSALELSPFSSSGTIDLSANNGRSVRITGGRVDGSVTPFQIPFTFTNSSGTAAATFININPTINNTGTYSGTVRGFYYNPTLTSISGTTHRAIETTSGNVIFNGGDVGIGTTGLVPGNILTINGSVAISAGQSLSLDVGAGIYMVAASSQFRVYNNSIAALSVANTGNVLINTTTDAGYKLDVNGTFRTLVGTETNPFRLEHTNGNYMTMIVGAGSALAAGQFGMYFNGTPMWSWNGAVFRLHGNTLSTASNPSTLVLQGGYGGSTVGTSIKLSSNTPNQGQWTATGGTQTTVEIGSNSNESWAPSSGNASYNLLSISPIINTTGTYSGIVRGLYYNPTLTSISGTTHRAIETVTGNVIFGSTSGNVLIGTATDTGYKLQVSGTSLFTGTFTSLTGGSSQVLYNMDLSQSAITGNTIYAVNISPTLRNTASGQTQVALRVMPTFTGSSTGTSTTNKIVDFGSEGVGTQFTVTDATTGDIYMVNDVSGLPIIAANSSWDVSMYNYPNTVFKKTNNSLLLGVQNNTGSTISVYGDLVINEGFGFTNTTTQVSGTTSTGATSASTIYTLTTSTNKSYSITCLTTGYGNTTRNTTSGRVEGAFRNSGGTLTMVGTTIQYVSANIESTNVDFEVSGTSIVLRVTGTTSENYTWGSTITSQVI